MIKKFRNNDYLFKLLTFVLYILFSVNNRWLKIDYFEYSLLLCSIILLIFIVFSSYNSKEKLKENILSILINVGFIALICFF